MNRIRKVAMVVALCLLPAMLGLVGIRPAEAHGTMQNPPSRVYTCWQEGPENPQSAACKAAVALGGTQPLYDWNEINIADAAGRHRQIIPDGKLCSAGRDKYKGFDLGRSDWRTTTLPQGGAYTFVYRATAPHRGTWEFYVTKNGYNPSVPLRWSDLEPTPFHTVTNPPLSNGAYYINVNLPAKSGRHLIYSIWQRSDSPEAFYTCSDVMFGNGPTPTPITPTPITPTPITPTPITPTPITPTPITPTPVTPTPGTYPAWAPNVSYSAGTRVSYGGKNYECWQSHTSLNGWEPPNVPALWKLLP